MELGYMLVFICCFMLPAHSFQLNKTLCEESLCLYLYEAGNTLLTWDQSHTACRDQGLEMLRIESSQTQTTVDRLLQYLPQNTMRLAWIGGRGSSDNTWRFMNGTEFNKATTTTEPDLYPYCIRVNICKDSSPRYVADNCDEKRSTSRVLCQYDKSRTGQCRSQDYEFDDKCYVKTQYDGSDPNKVDWYSGQTYCSQSPIQGDIAYSYLDDNQHINDVVSLLDDGDGCVVLWLGVRRRIWFWKADSGSDTSGQVIDYFNWFDKDTPIPSSDDNCIYIDGDEGNKWRVQSCTGSPLHYFICMNASTTATTTTSTTGTTTTSTISTTTTSTLIGLKETTLLRTLRSYKIALIVTVLVCIAVIIVNIGLIVVCLRYRRRISSKSSTVNQTEMSRNDVTSTRTTGSSGREQEVTQPVQYEELTVQTGHGHNTQISEVNPYETPSNYINMVDRPNTYEALNK